MIQHILKQPVEYTPRFWHGDSSDGRIAFTTNPLAQDVIIAGYVRANLKAAFSLRGGHTIPSEIKPVVFVYLAEVSAENHEVVRYITEGQYAVGHAPLDEPTKRDFTKANYNAVKMEGESTKVLQVVIDLEPVEYRVAKGNSLRLFFAAADSDNFAFVGDMAEMLDWHIHDGTSLTIPTA